LGSIPYYCVADRFDGEETQDLSTSSGFFDLAVAAPSMKVPAEAWGSRTNVFNQGFAKETHDPAIVAATMARPGVVLRRPVGSNSPFTEHAELPKDLPVEKVKAGPAKRRAFVTALAKVRKEFDLLFPSSDL
jgi:colicin import membrane protein